MNTRVKCWLWWRSISLRRFYKYQISKEGNVHKSKIPISFLSRNWLNKRFRIPSLSRSKEKYPSEFYSWGKQLSSGYPDESLFGFMRERITTVLIYCQKLMGSLWKEINAFVTSNSFQSSNIQPFSTKSSRYEDEIMLKCNLLHVNINPVLNTYSNFVL